VQHIEIARDIAQRFNHIYGSDYFTLPEASIEENVATLPGTDGRKMSKSYNNTIPLWLPAKDLKKAILGIVTDSRAPGEPKDTDTSNLFAIYQAFASADETAAMRRAFAEGIAWGDAKQKLFERIDAELAPQRARYDALIARPADIEEQLHAGARKARERSQAFIERLRWAVGVRRLTDRAASADAKKVRETDDASAALPQMKSYREADGKFYFKLESGDGATLLQSRGFASPKDAGRLVAALVDAGDDASALDALLENALPAGHATDPAVVATALGRLKADKLAREQARR
jgi:tryptophanyl-tRNA synthetase